MIAKRVSNFIFLWAFMMLTANFVLFSIGKKTYFPFILAAYFVVLLTGNHAFDFMLMLCLSMTMSVFVGFVPQFGTIGPWVFLMLLILSPSARSITRSKLSETLLLQCLLMVFLSVLGYMSLNPISMAVSLVNMIILLLCLFVLLRCSCYRFKVQDLVLLVYVLCFIAIYLSITSLNNYLGIIRTESPLFMNPYSGTIGIIGVSVFVGGSWDFFLVTNVFFLVLLLYDTKAKLNINKALLVLAYIMSFLGTWLVFSKTKIVLLLLFNASIYILNFRGARLKRYVYMGFSLVLLILGLVVASQYINLGYILDRFAEQPELFENVLDDPLRAQGTSRSEPFYWGWMRNTQRFWIIGYGWDTWNSNKNAYFHNLPIARMQSDFHSLYYSIIPIFGYIGGLIFIVWLLQFAMRSYSVLRFSKNPKIKVLGAAFLAMSLALLASGYSSTFTSTPSFFFILCVLMGVVNSMFVNIKEI